MYIHIFLVFSASCLGHLITIGPQLTQMVKQNLRGFPSFSQTSERREHYQLSGDFAVRSVTNALKLRHSIPKHCGGNSFIEETPLKNMASSALVPENAREDILQFKQKGQERFREFIQERLLSTSKLSVWDPLKKLKLKAFSNLMEKTKVSVVKR